MINLLCYAIALVDETPAKLGKVAGLTDRTAVRLKIVPIEKAVKEIAGSTKITLTVAASVRHHKVTVLAKEEPAGELLDAVADTVGCEWKPVKDGYELQEDHAFQQQLKSYEQAEWEEETKFMRLRVAGLAAAANVPFEDIQEAISELNQRNGEIVRHMNSGWQEQQKEVMDKLAGLSMAIQPDNYLAGSVLQKLDTEGWKKFWAGEALYASTATPKGGLQLPASTFAIAGAPRSRGAKVCIFLGLDPITVTLRYRSIIYGSTYPVGTAWAYDGVPPPIIERLLKHPFKALLSTWDSDDLNKLPELQLEVKHDGESPRASKFFSTFYSDSDHLEWFFEKTQLPVVAEAFRTPNRWSQLNNARGTAALWLRDFLKATEGWCKVRQRIVCIRRGEFWKLLRRETPESTLNTLETATDASLTLSDYADVSAKLNVYQRLVIGNPRMYLTTFDQYPFADGYPALRFFASLTSPQRRELLTRGGIAFKALSPDQQQQFEAALIAGAFEGAAYDSDLISAFDGTLNREDFESLGVFVTTGEMVRRPHPPRPMDPTETSISTVLKGQGIKFVFGMSPTKGVSYTIRKVVLR
jgi:hypothetical protein